MVQRKIVAIHQPNFFPWLGYFNKMARSDIFVFMDNVQFPKTGGTWINRVQLIVNKGPAWITVPIVRNYHGVRRVDQMEINNSTPWQSKLLKTVQMSYCHSHFFKSVYPVLEEVVAYSAAFLADFNVHAIRVLCAALGLGLDKMVLGSTIEADGKATDLLIAMVRAAGGTAYMCGGGAAGYQEDDKFAHAGIELIYQDFKHPTYCQSNTANFVPGLSIIDALMNCGFEGTSLLIKEG